MLESTTRSYQEGGKTTENILEAAIPIVFIIVYPFCLYVLTPEIHLIVCHESPSNSYLEDCPIDPLWKLHWNPMEIAWKYYGTPLEILLDITWKSYGNDM